MKGKRMKNKLRLALLIGAAFAAGAANAQQAEGNWMVRIRAVDIRPVDDSSDPLGILGSDAVKVQKKWIPEVDISYFFTKNIAAELILTYPQKHDVKVEGTLGLGKIGTFKHLPPTLTLQYHFMPEATFRPYVGAGINYTAISDVKLAVGATPVRLEHDSVGGALQVGFDYKIGPNSYLNLDLKKVYIQSDVRLQGVGKISTAKLDPLLVGIGWGFKF